MRGDFLRLISDVFLSALDHDREMLLTVLRFGLNFSPVWLSRANRHLFWTNLFVWNICYVYPEMGTIDMHYSSRQEVVGRWVMVVSPWLCREGVKTLTNGLFGFGRNRLPSYDFRDNSVRWLQILSGMAWCWSQWHSLVCNVSTSLQSTYFIIVRLFFHCH